MNADYRGKGIDQLTDVIETVKKNPNDRRMIIAVWNPAGMSAVYRACVFLKGSVLWSIIMYVCMHSYKPKMLMKFCTGVYILLHVKSNRDTVFAP